MTDLNLTSRREERVLSGCGAGGSIQGRGSQSMGSRDSKEAGVGGLKN